MSEKSLVYDHQTDGPPGELRPYNYEIDDSGFDSVSLERSDTSENKPNPFKRLVKSTPFVALVGAVSLMGCIDILNREYNKISEPNVPACPAPPPAAFRSIQALLTAPRPEVDSQTIADRLGLSFYEQRGASTVVMLQETPTNTVAGFNRLLTEANSFTSLYGVKIVKATSNKDEAYNLHVPTDSELTQADSSAVVIEIVADMAKLPVQYVHFSGLKQIILAANKDTDAAAYADNVTSAIHYNVAGNPGRNTFDHEVHHLIDDNKECGPESSELNDPAFTRLNKGDIYKRHQGVGILLDDYENLQSNLEVLNAEISNTYTTHDWYSYCRLRQKKLDSNIQVVAEHSLANAAEDKAELGELFADNNNAYHVLDPDYPVLKRKFEFLLARLFSHLPKVAEYFAILHAKPAYAESEQYDCNQLPKQQLTHP